MVEAEAGTDAILVILLIGGGTGTYKDEGTREGENIERGDRAW